MVYRTGSIIAANCMNLVFSNLFSDMVNVGFVFINANTSNAGPANTSSVWSWYKSPGANNAIGNDWYIGIATDVTAQTNCYFTIAAGYNTVTQNSVTGFPPVAGSMPCANAANTLASGQGANTCNNSGNVCTMGYITSFPTTGNGMLFYYSVLIDRVIISCANTSTPSNGGAWYMGTYDSFMPLTTDPYPLALANVAAVAASQNFANVTGGLNFIGISEPANTTTTTTNFLMGACYTWNQIPGLDPYLTAGALSAGRYPFCRIGVSGRGTVSGTAGFRGLLRDCLGSSVPSPQRGDTLSYTFNGTTYNYTYFGSGSQLIPAGIGQAFTPWVAQI
jgi:hypothetical protein